MIPVLSSANPILVLPVMSEVYFDENHNWKVEITDCYFLEFDSVMIESSSGISKINSFSSTYGDFIVITSDSLVTPLTIQKANDFIRLYFYTGDNIYHTDYVAFGNHEDSYIHNLQEGYSIARYGYTGDYSAYFYKCITPTPGWQNNLTGSEGYITGNIYDDGQLLTNGTFKLDETAVSISETGFSGTPLSRTYTSLWYNNLEFETAPITIEPNETTSCDIHFIYVSINTIESENITFSVFPNPAKDVVKFYYKVDFQIKEKMRIEIRDTNGKVIDIIHLQNNEEDFVTYHLKDIHKGLYICSLISNNAKLREAKLIIQ